MNDIKLSNMYLVVRFPDGEQAKVVYYGTSANCSRFINDQKQQHIYSAIPVMRDGELTGLAKEVIHTALYNQFGG